MCHTATKIRTSGVKRVGSRSARHSPHTVKGVIAALDTDFPGAAAAETWPVHVMQRMQERAAGKYANTVRALSAARVDYLA
jgi:hypothetical protein